jgi:hypothetical protein
MTYLTTSVRATLEEYKLSDIANRLDWNVPSDVASLAGADFWTVRR